MTSKTYRYCQKMKKMVEKGQEIAIKQPNFTILKAIEPFVSPIDGRVIDDRTRLREHNKEHGVTNIRDYGDKYFDRKTKERHARSTGDTREAKRERIEIINQELKKRGF